MIHIINSINSSSNILNGRFYSIHYSISQSKMKTCMCQHRPFNFQNRSLLCLARTLDVLVLVVSLRVMSRNCVCNMCPCRPSYSLST